MKSSKIIRFLDILFSIIGITVLFPCLLVVVVILKLTGEGEIFFTQVRVGLNRENFHIIKFATMVKNSPNMAGGDITIAGDPRITRVGRILRTTKINELPQLLNVLRGDMSLVGPRPLTPTVFNLYDEDSKVVVTSIRPGLTGISSLWFFSEEETLSAVSASRLEFYKSEIISKKSILEQSFVKRYSVSLYLAILISTAARVVRISGVFSNYIFQTDASMEI